MQNPKIIKTADGSHTLNHAGFSEHYHSTFGAIQESQHVFIKSGLDYLPTNLKKIDVLEIGFGTGLNALLTFLWANKNKTIVNYTGVEAYRIMVNLAEELNYPQLLKADAEIFLKMHLAQSEEIALSKYFNFNRITRLLQELQLRESVYDIVYFDAFSPDTQPELWTKTIFTKLNTAMKRGGVLTTYSTKGIVKRALKAAGFNIEKLPGPPGKREILRAVKF